MYFVLLEICDFYALSKLKSRLCIGLTLSIDLNPTIFFVYFGGNDLNKDFNLKKIVNRMSNKYFKNIFFSPDFEEFVFNSN